MVVVKNQPTAYAITASADLPEEKRVWHEIVIEIDLFHTGRMEIVPQSAGQLSPGCFVRHTFPQPFLIVEHKPGAGRGTDTEVIQKFLNDLREIGVAKGKRILPIIITVKQN